MGAAKKLESKVLDYFHHLSEKNQNVVLSVVKTLKEEEEKEKLYEFTEEQYDEFDRRLEGIKSGERKAYTLKQSNAEVSKALKGVKRK